MAATFIYPMAQIHAEAADVRLVLTVEARQGGRAPSEGDMIELDVRGMAGWAGTYLVERASSGAGHGVAGNDHDLQLTLKAGR